MEQQEFPVCREHFERIDARLQQLELDRDGQRRSFSELAVMSARMHEKLTTLDASLKSLIRALWGISGSLVAALLGFVLWYIQGGTP